MLQPIPVHLCWQIFTVMARGINLTQHGGVQTEIYKLYGKAYGWYSLLSLCFFWASEQSTNILTSWWLSEWTTAQILYQIEAAAGISRSYFAPLLIAIHTCICSYCYNVLSHTLMIDTRSI